MEQLVSAEVPPTLDDVAREFSLWRETRQHRGRIPNRLWDAAMELTSSYPASKVAEVLHLNYTQIERFRSTTTLKTLLQRSFHDLTPQRIEWIRLRRQIVPSQRVKDALITRFASVFFVSLRSESLNSGYSQFKKRLVPDEASNLDPRLSFVEVDVLNSSRAPSSSCQFEIETAHGPRFRCHVRGPVSDNLLRFIKTLV